ncbi:MAG: hypothetical protein L0G69_11925 [Brevibacterium sp.]|nr:hypothetical protein [Brevibacterium sp.]MDN5605595.1 hypothetical protein [Kocuria sp.]
MACIVDGYGPADIAVPADQSRSLHEYLSARGGESLLYLIEDFGHGFFKPGEVLELGPGIRLDNVRVEAEPETPFTADNSGSFDPAGRYPSFARVHDFFTDRLGAPKHWPRAAPNMQSRIDERTTMTTAFDWESVQKATILRGGLPGELAPFTLASGEGQRHHLGDWRRNTAGAGSCGTAGSHSVTPRYVVTLCV